MSRLLVLTELFLPTKGGTAVWAAEVYKRLGGKEIHIVTADVPGARAVDAVHPNTIHRISLKRVAWLRPESLAMYARFLFKALGLALTHRFDAIHAFRALPEGLVAWAVARLTLRPVVIYAHGEELTTWGRGGKYKAMCYALRHADRVVANSKHTRDTLDDIGGVIVGSVVPPLDAQLRAAIKDYLHFEPLFVAPGIRSGMPLKVETPLELGADRLCNAVAAYAEHGGPCVVVDFGTATTWEVVSERGEFLGGVIAPGLEISAEALFSRAAKLPRIELTAPPRVIGKATVDSMQAGLVYGYVGLVEGVTRRVLAELGGGKVVATGGLAQVIARYCDLFTAVDDDLTLKGLRLLWERNRPDQR